LGGRYPGLSEIAIRAAKSREQPYKLSDERGLYLLINPTGSRWWRFKYSRFGKERGLSFGVYPDVSLALARKRRDEARTLIADTLIQSCTADAKNPGDFGNFETQLRKGIIAGHGRLQARFGLRLQLPSFVRVAFRYKSELRRAY